MEEYLTTVITNSFFNEKLVLCCIVCKNKRINNITIAAGKG